jgi:hypothetical protein
MDRWARFDEGDDAAAVVVMVAAVGARRTENLLPRYDG